jgi:hypothetical protein
MMPTNFLVAAAIVVGGLWLIRSMAKTPPQGMPRLMRKVGGIVLIGVSALLALRGAFSTALPLFAFGLALVGINAPFMKNFGFGGEKSTAQSSRVVTSYLSMELEHDSGRMDGDILAGRFKGRRLASLSNSELKAFHLEVQQVPDQSRLLFEAWLDRSKAGWRDDWGQASSGSANAGSKMSREEAYAVLGLKAGASHEDIKAAHRRLMKDFHPDKGGSDYLAAKVNQAKDILIG